jgi:hypothetical protein
LKINAKQVLIYLAIAFVLVSIWKAPEATAQSAGDFLGATGGFLADVLDKGLSFVQGLFE